MEKLNFSIDINASKEKVWRALWDDANYRAWTSIFSEGSRAVSDWNQGSKIHFVDGDNNGMFSTIDTRVDNRQLTFRHHGEVHKGVEQPADPNWDGALESYHLSENNGTTTLDVELDINEEHKQYFGDTFPKALERVKQLAES